MIEGVRAKIILDSRKRPTTEVEVRTQNGRFLASCPSGASTGEKEAAAIDPEKAVNNINNIIAVKLLGENEKKQKKIDNIMIELDGTENKSRLGANAVLPVSIAVCRAGAGAKKLPLYKYINNTFAPTNTKVLSMPRPCFNIINGGAHAKNNLEIQEFMIIPDYKSFAKNLKTGQKIFEKLKKILEKGFGEKGVLMGDEGGFAPPIENDEKALAYISQAIGKYKINIGLDCAASEFFSKGKYEIDHKKLNRNELLRFYKELIKKYPIIFIEDPFDEKDDKGFKAGVRELSNTIIVGDDYLTTNIKRIKRAKKNKTATGIIIKPNQIGTVTETLEAVKLAKSYHWKTIVSHRSGETMDDFIADLAVGINSDFIKSGAPSKPERLAKYNRIAAIEKIE